MNHNFEKKRKKNHAFEKKRREDQLRKVDRKDWDKKLGSKCLQLQKPTPLSKLHVATKKSIVVLKKREILPQCKPFDLRRLKLKNPVLL